MRPGFVLFVVIVLWAVVVSVPAQPTRFPHWKMIQEVVQQLESRPPRPSSISASLQTPGQEYPFEAFRHLRAIDLLRAAREGVMFARQQAILGADSLEAERKALNNVMIALEYLPTILRDAAEVQEVVKALEDRSEAPVLRRYLLSQFDIESPARALLGITFEDYVPLMPEYFRKVFTSLASHPAERPDIQAEAIRIYYARLCRAYEEARRQHPDAAIPPQASATVAPPVALEDLSTLLNEEARGNGKAIARDIQSFAREIAGHIAENSARDNRVQEETRRVLLHMKDHIALPNPEHMALYLEGRMPREEPSFLPLPIPFPAQEGEEEFPSGFPDPSDPFSWPEPTR